MKKIILYTMVALLAFSCSDNDAVENENNCDRSVVISEDLYENGPDDDLAIIDVKVVGHCLEITYGASGCDGDSWEIALYDSSAVLYSDPPIRQLRLSLKNQEVCLAYFTKTISFDIQVLQLEGNNTVKLELDNFDTQIVYEY